MWEKLKKKLTKFASNKFLLTRHYTSNTLNWITGKSLSNLKPQLILILLNNKMAKLFFSINILETDFYFISHPAGKFWEERQSYTWLMCWWLTNSRKAGESSTAPVCFAIRGRRDPIDPPPVLVEHERHTPRTSPEDINSEIALSRARFPLDENVVL